VGVQLQQPLRTVTPTIDGDVLRVLARADSWFAASRLRALAGTGSPEGIRKVLKRLVDQGIVETQVAGKAFLYRLNREHLAAPAIIELAHLDEIFRDRAREAIEQFHVKPVYAFLFGSAARGMMREDSDIVLVGDETTDDRWENDLQTLRDKIHRWTGNDPRVIVYDRSEILGARDDEPVLDSIASEGISLVGNASRYRKDISPR
jgi:predicted nucleotidyltransferase